LDCLKHRNCILKSLNFVDILIKNAVLNDDNEEKIISLVAQKIRCSSIRDLHLLSWPPSLSIYPSIHVLPWILGSKHFNIVLILASGKVLKPTRRGNEKYITGLLPKELIQLLVAFISCVCHNLERVFRNIIDQTRSTKFLIQQQQSLSHEDRHISYTKAIEDYQIQLRPPQPSVSRQRPPLIRGSFAAKVGEDLVSAS
jgi:hypothetical protein